jgi:hypothetical protein
VACDPETKQPLFVEQSRSSSSSGLQRHGNSLQLGSKESRTGYYDWSDNIFVKPDGTRVKVVVNKNHRARG